MLWPNGVRLELIAQLLHVDPKVVRVARVGRSPYFSEQLTVVITIRICLARAAIRRNSIGVR